MLRLASRRFVRGVQGGSPRLLVNASGIQGLATATVSAPAPSTQTSYFSSVPAGSASNPAMRNYKGSCNCGNVSFQLSLSQPLSNYVTRKCDCEFCTTQSRAVEWLSDPKGELKLPVTARSSYRQQGSEQARFLACVNCKHVFTVVYQFSPKQWFGAVNYWALSDAKGEGEHDTAAISPKTLAPDVKASRWQELWCPVTWVAGKL